MTTEIILNGAVQQTTAHTLAELVASLELTQRRFAIEVNQQLIPKSQLADTLVHAHDQIEIIQAVGGG